MSIRKSWARRNVLLLTLLASGCSSDQVGNGHKQSTDKSRTDDDDDTGDDGEDGDDNPKGSTKDGGKDAGKKDGGKDAGKTDRDAGTVKDSGDGEDEEDADVTEPPPSKEFERKACTVVPARGADGATGPLSLDVQVVAQDLDVPWGLAWLPDGDILLTERGGTLRRISGGKLQSQPVLTVAVAEISLAEQGLGLGSEGGLLGVLVHPEYEDNHLIYLYYTTRDSRNALINRLVAYQLLDDGTITQQAILVDNIPGGVHHQGGRMQVGPDGKLYVGVGAYDPSLAQKPDQLPGKLLRLNFDGSIPEDNPDPDSFVFLTGVRNTQGYDWWDDTHLLLMDHGPTAIDPGVPQKGWDEFNVARAGENFGWPNQLGCTKASGRVEPVMTWERSMPPGGAAIYRGTSIPEWKGSFIVAALGMMGDGEHLQRIKVSDDNPYVVEKSEMYLKGQYGRLRTVAMGPDGHLYLTTSNCDPRGITNGRCANGGDQLLRIVGTK